MRKRGLMNHGWFLRIPKRTLQSPCAAEGRRSEPTIKFLILHPSKNFKIINYAIMGANITSKYFWGIFFCSGLVACRNGILSRIIGQPRAWVIGSESWKRSIAWKVSDSWCRRGRSEVPFFFGFLQFSRSRRLRDNRQQLPGNVQKTLKSLETNKKKRRCKKQRKTTKNGEKKRS